MNKEKYHGGVKDLYWYIPDKLGPFNYYKDGLNVEDYSSNVLRWLMRELPERPRILDLGSGLGMAADELERMGASVVRLDTTQVALTNQKGDRVKASALDLPFELGSFDAIHCKDMYGHIPPELRKNFFSEVRRVLTRKGYALFVFSPTFRHTWVSYLYVTDRNEFIADARDFGLKDKKVWSWKPTQEKDWYTNSAMKRDVVLLRKGRRRKKLFFV